RIAHLASARTVNIRVSPRGPPTGFDPAAPPAAPPADSCARPVFRSPARTADASRPAGCSRPWRLLTWAERPTQAGRAGELPALGPRSAPPLASPAPTPP